MTNLTIAAAIALGARALRAHRCAASAPDREAVTLLAFATGRSEQDLLLRRDGPVTMRSLRTYRAALRRRVRHAPLARISGEARFLGRAFRVDRSTLIPRIATERIVEETIAAARLFPHPRIVDVGTGSGCIAVSVALELPETRVLATDRSAAALRMARANARRLRATNVAFARGDLLAPLRRSSFLALRSPLILAANLPYLPVRLWKTLPPDIRDHEPRTALISGRDGLDAYRALLRSPILAAHDGPLVMILECLPSQTRTLSVMLRDALPHAAVSRIRNVFGIAVGVRAERHARSSR